MPTYYIVEGTYVKSVCVNMEAEGLDTDCLYAQLVNNPICFGKEESTIEDVIESITKLTYNIMSAKFEAKYIRGSFFIYNFAEGPVVFICDNNSNVDINVLRCEISTVVYATVKHQSEFPQIVEAFRSACDLTKAKVYKQCDRETWHQRADLQSALALATYCRAATSEFNFVAAMRDRIV